jgi:hypothetical protein
MKGHSRGNDKKGPPPPPPPSRRELIIEILKTLSAYSALIVPALLYLWSHL